MTEGPNGVLSRSSVTGSITEPLLVAAVLVGHAVICWSATLQSSTTYDEILHLTAGVSYWQRNDYRLQPENGNLPQRWCALPLLIMQPAFPPADDPNWRDSAALFLGRDFFYELGNDPDSMLAAARCMAVCWSAALVLLVYLWSRSLFGVGGGFVSLSLAAAWPALLAHGPLATSDVCGSLFFTLALAAIWKLLNRVTVGTLAAAGVSVGLAMIAKHSAVLLVPIAGLLVIATAVLGTPCNLAFLGRQTAIHRRGLRLLASLLSGIVVAATAIAVIWIACGCRFEAASPRWLPQQFAAYGSFSGITRLAGGIGKACDILAARRLLPESWLYGLSYVAAHGQQRQAFALGHYSQTGWWWFFPLCLVIKNTLPSLIVVGLGLVYCGRQWRSTPGYRCLPLVVAVAVLWPIFLTTRLNIGERHLLPSYPALMILAGGAWPLVAHRRGVRWVVPLLCVLHAADAGRHYPHHLEYFNQIVPSSERHRWLVDSNLDWGQELRRLGRRLAESDNSSEPTYLAYFGTGMPSHYGIQAEVLGMPDDDAAVQRLRPGLYCVSATALAAVYTDPAGRWCRKFEATYQNLRAKIASPLLDERARGVLNALQAARLLAWLRYRSPDESIGGAILLFHLDQEEIDAAIAGPPRELDDESWRDRERRKRTAAEKRHPGIALFLAGQHCL